MVFFWRIGKVNQSWQLLCWMQQIILILSKMELKQQKVVVYQSDVTLLLLMAHYDNIHCMGIQMKFLSGFTSITAVQEFLGHEVAAVFLLFHTLTSYDVIRKFSGQSKYHSGIIIVAFMLVRRGEHQKMSRAEWLRHDTSI